jgi:hypothetical protein
MATLFRAEFDGTSGTELRGLSYTPEVGAFTNEIASGGALQLDGNGYARSVSSGAVRQAVFTPTSAVSDFTMDVVMRTEGSSGDYTSVHFRRSDANNFLRLSLSSDGVVDLTSVVSGTATLISDYATGIVGEDITIRLEALGSSIKVYINDTYCIDETVTDHQTATGFRLRNTNSALPSGRFGRVEVSDISVGQTIRPNSTVSASGWTASDTTLHSDTSDQSNTTFASASADDAVMTLGLAAPSPALSSVDSMILHVRTRIGS